MREFIYFSKSASTTGNFKDLMKAGRMDIVLHSIIASLFISNQMRPDVKLHLIFYGRPTPPRHIELETSEELNNILSKKDVAGLIKRILFKYKEGKKIEAFPSCHIEKRSLTDVVKDLKKEGKEIFILEKKGTNLRKEKLPENSVFIIGDHEGLPKDELKRLKKISTKVSLGPQTYFASQSIVILQNELDIREK
jgi:tRNA (pseudouridine54-N1)-methyltransferase